MDARDRFNELISRPEHEIPLAEAALWISAEARPDVDVEHWLHEMDQMASRIAPRLQGAESPLRRVEILNQCLFEQEGFCGNQADYANPANSFLDAVLETRKGIPITLSIVYLEIAKRLEIPATGVGFPGHFLVKVEANETQIIVDPFFGRILNRDDCEDLLRKVAGEDAALTPPMLEATPHREILQRVLRNLKLVYLREKKFENALACSDRIVALADKDLSELRDRGLLYRELECAAAALHDLER
ncbi:MAG: tetratricopeptide repeat protein, partial [Myxococcota bacterium]|nr:tetratricopeptide repeat protein [Myxococcota bacterium]